MRCSHFSKDSQIFWYLHQSLSYCLEMLPILCDDMSTAETGEGFIMHYCTFSNTKKGTQHLVGPCTTPPPHLRRKAEQYVRDKIPLFVLVPDSVDQFPPHRATLEEVTTLPYKIPESALKERWLPNRGRPHNKWRTIKNVEIELPRKEPETTY